MMKYKNFNAFTMEGILEKINDFCKDNGIYRNNILSLSICPNGSVTMFYYEDSIYD